jgi:hypothetical protein
MQRHDQTSPLIHAFLTASAALGASVLWNVARSCFVLPPGLPHCFLCTGGFWSRFIHSAFFFAVFRRAVAFILAMWKTEIIMTKA